MGRIEEAVNLFDDSDGSDLDDLRCENPRCTPELLGEFMRRCDRINGKQPTLEECKREFGGILGPMGCYWELIRRGVVRNGKLQPPAVAGRIGGAS